MIFIPLLLAFFAVFVLILGFIPLDDRPTLKLDIGGATGEFRPKSSKKKFSIFAILVFPIRKLAFINKPLVYSSLGKRVAKDLALSQLGISIEEYFLIKEIAVGLFIFLVFKIPDPGLYMFGILLSIAAGYILPDFWLKGKVKKIKEQLIKELPDTVDLLGLCVNAGLDFMMAIKYIIEKSPSSVLIEELRIMIQEISVGKSRREALRDLAHKYELADLYTFSRTLIQADKMGTSVAEALNILSEDMREARFRRGETMALKAPLKMLVPLLLCIFPVVAILVAGPIFIDFFHNNPLQKLGQ